MELEAGGMEVLGRLGVWKVGDCEEGGWRLVFTKHSSQLLRFSFWLPAASLQLPSFKLPDFSF